LILKFEYLPSIIDAEPIGVPRSVLIIERYGEVGFYLRPIETRCVERLEKDEEIDDLEIQKLF